MGLSSNQARFLTLTSRQIDLEHRMQQICQKRLRLASQSQVAANIYNDKTSDRRLFLNTVNSYSTVAPGTKGPLTHDVLTDNNAYETLSAQNLYDNGLHIFKNNILVNVLDDGSLKVKKNNTSHSFFQSVIGTHELGDWLSNGQYRIYDKVLHPNAYANGSIPVPGPGVSGTRVDIVVESPVAGAATKTTPEMGAWSNPGLPSYQDPETGIAIMNYIRTGLVEVSIPAPPELLKFTGFVNRLSDSQLKTAAGTSNTLVIDSKEDFLNALLDIKLTSGIGKTYILAHNIDLAEQSFDKNVIAQEFKGTFDGQGYTISGISISAAANTQKVGFFSSIGTTGTVKNLELKDVVINAGNNTSAVGTFAGVNNGTVDNVMVTNATLYGGKAQQSVGGFIGSSNGTILNSSSSTQMMIGGENESTIKNPYIGSGGNVTNGGGFIGYLGGGSITKCKSEAPMNVYQGDNLGGFIGGSNGGTINKCYAYGGTYIATAGFTAAQGTQPQSTSIGGFIGYSGGTSVSYSYTEASLATANGMVNPEGFRGNGTISAVANTYSGLNGALVGASPLTSTGGGGYGPSTWTDTDWKTGGGKYGNHVFKTPSYDFKTVTTWKETTQTEFNAGTNHEYLAYEYEDTTLTPEELEIGLRNDTIKLAKHADALTQNITTYQGSPEKYEFVDWRTQPVISDDEYTANDEAAQMLYDKTIRDVNNQDKILEIEQNNVETEYKAITSEKDAVDKIIDTNIKASFKYFG